MPVFIQLTQVGDDPDTYHVAVDKIAYVQETAAGATRVHFHGGYHVSVRESFAVIAQKIAEAAAAL
jgi:hypothetical protein